MRFFLLVVLLVCAMLGSCAGKPRAANAADLPDDFGVSITVLAPGEGTMEPAWYVLGQDNVLHGALGERLTSSTFPPMLRVLSREQVRRVWELIVAGGLTGEGMAPVADSQVGAPGRCALMCVSAMGRRKSFVVPAERRADLEPIVAEIRRVGWVR